MNVYNHYIGAESIQPATGEYLDSQNPYTGEVWAQIPRGNADDANRAVATAKTAFASWKRTKPDARGKLLLRLADLIEENSERLAEIEVRDNGRVYAEVSGQMKYIAEWYRYYGGLADKVEGSVIPTDKSNSFNFTRHEPLGVVTMITPWNSPLLLLGWKLPTALAAGNTVVIKPSEFTSASTLEFVRLFEEAGFPPGVVNVVTGLGTEIGTVLVSHPDVAKIAFTGSDTAGKQIYKSAAEDFKHVSLELGGKSPNIVFEDADLEAAVMGVISGIFAAAGQLCIAGSRLLVQSSIHDLVVERLVEVARHTQLGDPMNPETQVGPVTTPLQFKKVLDYIDIAAKEGARCVLGGEAHIDADGISRQIIQPTIFVDVDNSMRIAQEEVFGPVLSVIRFDDEEDAIVKANDTIYGLAAGVWTSDIGRAIRMSEELEAGTVWINTYRDVSFTSPFGGYKHSGLGRESGVEAIKEYLQTKSVWISTDPSTENPFVMR
ncbi:carnitine dehydratase [Rhodococcus sp. KBW08]|uniref:aldehyde dehydrogenase n=1 Tax=Rhodococcus sp. KBW08 TaxID=2144188 RepID=UPI000F59D328|nr:aldehyde dehydrogenase [Rhodococcus sp. KBW08]RQO46047.1 carnitine dehydratase [Rhodococcus sp. KBW08]